MMMKMLTIVLCYFIVLWCFWKQNAAPNACNFSCKMQSATNIRDRCGNWKSEKVC